MNTLLHALNPPITGVLSGVLITHSRVFLKRLQKSGSNKEKTVPQLRQ